MRSLWLVCPSGGPGLHLLLPGLHFPGPPITEVALFSRSSNLFPLQVFVAYICAFLGYMFIRVTKTLALGNYLVYGLFVLAVEILGASTTFIYGAPFILQMFATQVLWTHSLGLHHARLLVCRTAGCCALSTQLQMLSTTGCPWKQQINCLLPLCKCISLILTPVNPELERMNAGKEKRPNDSILIQNSLHRLYCTGTNLIFTPVNPELERMKARKGKEAQLPVSDSASVKSGLPDDMSVVGDLEEGGVGKVTLVAGILQCKNSWSARTAGAGVQPGRRRRPQGTAHARPGSHKLCRGYRNRLNWFCAQVRTRMIFLWGTTTSAC